MVKEQLEDYSNNTGFKTHYLFIDIPPEKL
jgi:hypothetical protein